MKSAALKFFLAALLALVALPAFAQADRKPVISVLDFKTSGISEAEVVVFVDYLSSHIVETGRFKVIDRTQRQALLEEIEFSASDCTDESCQLQIGRLLSANQIIVGSIGRVGERYLLTLKNIEVETGETLKTGSERYTTLEELIDDARRLAFDFAGEKPGGRRAGGATAAKKRTEKRPETGTPFRHSALAWFGHMQGERDVDELLLGGSYSYMLGDLFALSGGFGYGLWYGGPLVTAGGAFSPFPFLLVGLRVGYCRVNFETDTLERAAEGGFCLNPNLLLRFGRLSVGGEFGWSPVGAIWYAAGLGLNL